MVATLPLLNPLFLLPPSAQWDARNIVGSYSSTNANLMRPLVNDHQFLEAGCRTKEKHSSLPNTKLLPFDLHKLQTFATAAAAACTILASCVSFPLPAGAEMGKIIEGPSNAEMLEITLQPRKSMLIEPDTLLYSTDGIELFRTYRGTDTWNRVFLDGKIAIDECINRGTKHAQVGLAPHFPSRIIPIQLEDYGGTILGNEGSFLASPPSVELDYDWESVSGRWLDSFQKVERMKGSGTVYVMGSGNILAKKIGPGEKLRMHEGGWVAMTDKMKLRYVKQRKSFLSSWMLEVEGPGTVWIDTAPISRIVDELDARLPQRSSEQKKNVNED